MNKLLPLLILFIPSLANGQNLLTLNEAVEISLNNNYDIIISKKELQAAENDVSLGNAGFLPKVDVNLDYSRGQSDIRETTVAGQELDKSAGKSYHIGAGVNLKWTLFDGFSMFANYEALKKIKQIGENKAKKVIENNIAEIIQCYYDLAKEAKLSSFIKEQVGVSEFRLQVAQANYEAGSGSELELNRAKVDLNFDKSDMSKQKLAYENKKTNLNMLIARDVKIDFSVDDSMPLDKVMAYDSLNVYMKSNNKDITELRQYKHLNELQAEDVYSLQYPSIDFHLGYNYLKGETETHFINYNRNYGFLFGLSASYNIFNGFNDTRKYQNAKIAIETGDLKIKRLTLELDALLLKTYNEYLVEKQLIELEEENTKLAAKNMDISKESYSIGSVSSLQLRDVQKGLLKASVRLIETQYKAKVKETELLLISGMILK